MPWRGAPRRTDPVGLTLATLAVVVLVAVASPARADGFDDVRSRRALIWGADQEGGAPYVYPRDDHPEQVTGFEVELAGVLARYLKVEPQFAQSNWDKLPDMLRARKVDIVLNGYEWTATRAEQMACTLPYYVYALQLLARKNDASIRSTDDLAKPKPSGDKRRVGVLNGFGRPALGRGAPGLRCRDCRLRRQH